MTTNIGTLIIIVCLIFVCIIGVGAMSKQHDATQDAMTTATPSTWNCIEACDSQFVTNPETRDAQAAIECVAQCVSE